MKNIKIDQFEIENIEDCLKSFEKDFKIKLHSDEIEKLSTFQAFCDLVISKINLEHEETCTTQQSFYKFRKALIKNNFEASISVNPDSKLKDIFPGRNRIQNIKQIEKDMDLEFEILTPHQYVVNALVIMFGLSLFGLLFISKIAGVGLIISVVGFYFLKFTKRLEIKTVRELIEKITALNYLKLRNKKNTVNKSELKTVIINWFTENAGISKEKLKYGTF